MPRYRKKKSSNKWHFCMNCNYWPYEPGTYEEMVLSGKPESGELCKECMKRNKEKDCRKI